MIPILVSCERTALLTNKIPKKSLSAACLMLNGPVEHPWDIPTPIAQSPTIVFNLTKVVPSSLFLSEASFNTYTTVLNSPKRAIDEIVKLVVKENNPAPCFKL
mmetsp:Transcript_759/g.1647  ORF Transcript_759/g.1647 Transcript_759/m.1647 type:complete len:103 (-) Transcript_759:1104-1412(-)